MFAQERQQKIYDIICAQKSMRVQELSKLLNISEVTVRRDLEELHRQKKVIRTHGGAVAYYPVGKGINVTELISGEKQLAQKQAIAAEAFKYINDYDTILLDGSSTVYELVKLLARQTVKKNLIIITTSALSVLALSSVQNCQVIMAGGLVSYTHNTVEGQITSKFIQEIRVDKCFIGINGVDETFGYSTPRFEDAEIKMQAIASASQSFVLADHTKLAKVYLARVSSVCDYFITDERVSDFAYDSFDSQTTVVFAGSGKAAEKQKL